MEIDWGALSTTGAVGLGALIFWDLSQFFRGSWLGSSLSSPDTKPPQKAIGWLVNWSKMGLSSSMVLDCLLRYQASIIA